VTDSNSNSELHVPSCTKSTPKGFALRALEQKFKRVENTARCKRYRCKLNEKKKAQYCEKARIRMRDFEIRQKETLNCQTIEEIQNNRKAWRELKDKWWKKLTPEAREVKLEKRREAFRRKTLLPSS
jgi:hypothetical protein